VEAVTPENIQAWILAGLPEADVRVEGDGHHFEAYVASSAFKGKSLIEQHRQVYACLGDHMKERVHALSLKTHVKQ